MFTVQSNQANNTFGEYFSWLYDFNRSRWIWKLQVECFLSSLFWDAVITLDFILKKKKERKKVREWGGAGDMKTHAQEYRKRIVSTFLLGFKLLTWLKHLKVQSERKCENHLPKGAEINWGRETKSNIRKIHNHYPGRNEGIWNPSQSLPLSLSPRGWNIWRGTSKIQSITPVFGL